MKTRIQFRFSSLLTSLMGVAAVILVVSCAPKSADRDGGSLNGGERTTPQLGGAGTTDSGGGTGLKDEEMSKMFEHYIVDPTKLPAYIKHIEPLFKNIAASHQNGSNLAAFFGMKTWYIAPVDFEKMSKDSLGVSFLKTSTIQIARHTKRSVWIKKELFAEQGAKEQGSIEQAETILHEWVMTAYFMKFMRVAEFCKFESAIAEAKKCADKSELFEKAYPPEALRELNEEDNENIRVVTAWLMANRERKVSVEELYSVFYRNGFDRRFFDPTKLEEKNGKLKDLKLPLQEVLLAIQGTERAGQLPNVCKGLSFDKPQNCRVTIEPTVTELKVDQLVIPQKGIRIKIEAEGAPLIEAKMVTGEEVTLPASEDGRDGIVYQLSLSEISTRPQVGDRQHFAIMWFRNENAGPHSPLNLEAISWKVAEIVSIDKSRDPICLVRTPKVTTLTDDQILIRHPNSKVNFIEDYFMKSPPFGICF